MCKKSVMHVQSCFANLNLSVYCFVVLVTVAVVVAIQKFGYHGNLTSHFYSLFNALNKDTPFMTAFLCPLSVQSVRINGVWLNKCYSAWLCLPLWLLLAFSSSVSLHIELILIVICGVNSAVIQWLDWSVVVAHVRRISTMFTLKFPKLVKLKHRKKKLKYIN